MSTYGWRKDKQKMGSHIGQSKIEIVHRLAFRLKGKPSKHWMRKKSEFKWSLRLNQNQVKVDEQKYDLNQNLVYTSKQSN